MILNNRVSVAKKTEQNDRTSIIVGAPILQIQILQCDCKSANEDKKVISLTFLTFLLRTMAMSNIKEAKCGLVRSEMRNVRFSTRLSAVIRSSEYVSREVFKGSHGCCSSRQSQCFRSRFRQIRYEAGNSDRQDNDETMSLTILADKFIDESPNMHDIKSFIHSNGVCPLHVYCWSEEGIRIITIFVKKASSFLMPRGV